MATTLLTHLRYPFHASYLAMLVDCEIVLSQLEELVETRMVTPQEWKKFYEDREPAKTDKLEFRISEMRFVVAPDRQTVGGASKAAATKPEGIMKK
jgi:hypothetical protein